LSDSIVGRVFPPSPAVENHEHHRGRSCIAGTFHEIDRCARSVAPGCDSERSFHCPVGEAQRAVGCSGGPINGAGQHDRSDDVANGYAYKAATKRRQRH
jgi:hypothetical protein